MNNFLIPANSKKSQLILGFMNLIDIIILGCGIMFTVVMLLIIQTNKLSVMLLILLPALISVFLVLPVPNYHNILQLITNIFTFFIRKRRYYWKGWSMYEE